MTIDVDNMTEEQRQAIREEGLAIQSLEPVMGKGEEAGLPVHDKTT